ncbi:uncharacterized protein LOC144652183 [Oculina patagonica]
MADEEQPAVQRPRQDQGAINAAQAVVPQVEPPAAAEPAPLQQENPNPPPKQLEDNVVETLKARLKALENLNKPSVEVLLHKIMPCLLRVAWISINTRPCSWQRSCASNAHHEKFTYYSVMLQEIHQRLHKPKERSSITASSVQFPQWEIDPDFRPLEVPLNNLKWVLCNSTPIQEVPCLAASNQHLRPDFVQDVIAGKALADPSMLAFRDPHHFLAGQLHNFCETWLSITSQTDSDTPKEVLGWIEDGVTVFKYFRHFRGSFKGENFDCELPPCKIFQNHISCKPFASFISRSILDRLATGAISLWVNHKIILIIITFFLHNTHKRFPNIAALQGYVHSLTKILTSTNRKTNYFLFDLQTDNQETVQLVCYSPKKRKPLKHLSTKKANKIQSKTQQEKTSSTTNEYTLDKDSEIELSNNLPLDFNSSLDDHLHTVEQALRADIYKTVDLKVKIIMKNENKQSILHDGRPTYNCDSLVADHTDCIKLVLWKDKIDEVHSRKSYHFQNVTLRRFDDDKHVNTNQSTIIKEIEDITNINLDITQIKNNIITGKIIGIEVKKTTGCVACNKAITCTTENKEDMYNCSNCSMTTLLSLCATKVVGQIVLKTSKDISTYVAFSDGLLSFLANTKSTELSLSQQFLPAV